MVETFDEANEDRNLELTMSTTTPPASSTSTKTALVITSFPSNPLTTTFTRGDNCGGINNPSRPPILMIDDEPSCMPPGFTGASSAFFSPGIACPSGYWTACHDTTGVASITTVTCCPTYGADISLSCVPNPLSLSEVWETMFCTWMAPRSPGTVITLTKSEDGRTSTVTERITANAGINAYGVRMVYQSSDLNPSSSSTSSTSASEDASSTPANPTANPYAGPSSSNGAVTTSGPEPGGLSTGAKAAIGVVVPLLVIGALVAGFLLWRRRRGAREAALSSAPPPPQPPSEGLEHTQYEHYVPAKQPGYDHYYSGTPQPHEMTTHWAASELPSTRAAVELPGELAGGGVQNQRWR